MSDGFPAGLRRILADPQAVSDADLIQRYVLHHDQAAFELLVWRHAALVMSVCRGILRDHHLAEDAFQAVFLALARKAGSISQREAVAGWLHRVAHNAALKARQRRDRHTDQPLVDEPTAPDTPVQDDVAPLLHEELARLPDRYRLPLVLCFLEGQSHTDAAEQLGWPKGTVAGRIARAREVLRQRLTRRGVALPATLFTAALTPAIGSAQMPTLVSATVQASLAFASGNAAAISGPVLHLAEGVFRAMFFAKVKSAALVLCLLGVLVLGGLGTLAIAQKPADAEKDPTKPEAPQADAQTIQKLKTRSMNNLKELALAVHNHLDTNNVFPANIVSADKKPLLSWRVQLLPALDMKDLYNEFKLDEPWDSKHNIKLLSKIPKVFLTGTESKDSTDTYYQGFAHADAMFPPGLQLRIAHITDGLSNTLLFVEAGTAVPWTKPADLPYDANKPLPKLGGPFKDVIHGAFADGAVMPIKREFDEKTMRLAITRNDNEVVEVDKLRAYRLPPKPPRKLTPLEAVQEAEARARAEAEMAERMALEARRQAELAAKMTLESRRQAEEFRAGSEKMKAELRDVINHIEKSLAAKDEGKPAADEVKALRTELRLLRDRLKRLEQSLAR